MEAAKLAGYSHKRARQEGSELMNPRLSPLVAKFIGNLREERLKKFEVNYETHVAELDRIKQSGFEERVHFPLQ
jgi:phage terminase small subunit